MANQPWHSWIRLVPQTLGDSLMESSCHFPGTCRNCRCRLSTGLCLPSSLSHDRRGSASHFWAKKSSFAHAEMNVRVLHQASEPKWVQWWSKSLLKHHAAGNKFRYLHTQWFKTYVGALILENLSVWPRGHSRGFPLRPIFLIPKSQFSNLTLILCDLYPDEDH